MVYVPVLSCSGKPLMPCHPARARELVRQGRAVRRFNRGLFYIQLLERKEGNIQPIAVGIDPGSKKEGFSVKSKVHTYLNIQADALSGVKETIEVRRTMRRARRFRKTPCQKNRYNRAKSPFPPSKARWQWKLRLCRWLSKLFPIACFIVEDMKARTLRGKRWNTFFSPLQVGKQWLYEALNKIAQVETKQGFETKELRDALGLKKTGHKRAEVFEAHCIDSWVLANGWTGGHLQPDNKQLLCITPPRFHRRQPHRLQFSSGGIRKPCGGTLSHGFKRGSLVKRPKWGLAYVGGFLKDRISLHATSTGKRLCQNAHPAECRFFNL